MAMASDRMALACFLSRREKLIASMLVAACATHQLGMPFQDVKQAHYNLSCSSYACKVLCKPCSSQHSSVKMELCILHH